MAKARLLLADDHTLVVEAFKRVLEPEFSVVGTVSDGHALLKAAAALKPDLVLVDLNMPLLNGNDAGKQLKAAHPGIKIIVLTMNEDAETAAESLSLWASGYILKKSTSAELIHAVHHVMGGGRYVAPAIQEHIEKNGATTRRTAARTLTPRQREVVQLLAEGRTMKEAAGILHVATRTIAFHKYRVMNEFGLKTNSDLVRLAMKEKLVSPQ